MTDKLVKEIITTTTERFSDSGSIKEKVTESREKIYQYGYTDKQIEEAEVISKDSDEPTENKSASSNEDLIKQAASSIDANKANQQPQMQQQYVAPQQQQYGAPQQQYQPQPVPQYNRVGVNPAQVQDTKFPWEKK